MVNSTAVSTGSPERRVPSPADSLGRPYARQPLSLLDYRWSKKQPGHRHSGLQHLLDPAHTLTEMPLTYQGAQARTADLPELNGLYTQHASTLPPAAPPPAQPTEPTGATAVNLDLVTAQEQVLAPTLEDSVIEGLIRALYNALPDNLSNTEAETTPSGNKLGRHGYAPRVTPAEHWLPVTAPPRPPEQDAPASATPPNQEPPPEPDPRPYVLGAVPDGLQLSTLRSLAELEVQLPADAGVGLLSGQTVLGTGEPCFLRAQSALWSWRTHRQVNMDIYAHGPPFTGRNALVEQKIGPVTLLLGCRVTDMIEESRRWGFTLGSLSGQVLVCHEEFLVEWQPDDTVVFSVRTQQQLAMPSLTFLGPVHSALRRKFKQGYLKNMVELTAD